MLNANIVVNEEGIRGLMPCNIFRYSEFEFF